MRPLLPILLLTLATRALASDGVLEINETCAVQTGCFPGDAPGLPVFITQSGSYRLTSNLTLADENTNGIQIEAPAVSLDLGGFAILGPTTCTHGGEPVQTTCSPLGSGIGVVGAEPNFGIRIRNGVVRGAGAVGLAVPSAGVIEDVGAFDNGAGGIFGSLGARIRSCQASRNGGFGVQGIDDVQIIDCIAEFNGGDGFELLGSGGEVRGVHARSNVLQGIDAGLSATVVGNSATSNGGNGISASEGSLVSGNASIGNGSVGIVALDRTNVQGNSVRQNSGFGLECGSTGCAYGNNTITDNATGSIGGVSQNLGGNFCEGPSIFSAECP